MRELLKLDFQRLFDGVLFKLALGVCAVLGIWDLVLNVQAHYANMEALKTQTIAYSYPSSVYNSCIAADGLYLPSILLFSLFPLLVTLPAGVSMAMDIKSGYIKNLRVRKEQKSVILSRYISIFAGAFLLAMAATFGQMIFSMMFLPTISPEIASYTFPMMAVGQVGHSFYAVHPFLYLLLYNLYDAVYLAGIATLALPLGWLTGNPFVSLIGPTAIFYFMGFFFDTFSASQWEPSCILPPYSDIYLSLPIMIIELCILLVISALLAMTCAVKKHDVF